MKNKILLLLLCFVVSERITAQRIYSDKTVKRLMHRSCGRYHLAKNTFELKDTNIVSSNTAYLEVYKTDTRDSCIYYSFKRFFPDGWVYTSLFYNSYPGIEAFNDLSYGIYGHYIIDDNNVLVMESYVNSYDGIQFLYAKATKDGLSFYTSRPRTFALYRVYYPINIHLKKIYPKLKEIPY